MLDTLTLATAPDAGESTMRQPASVFGQRDLDIMGMDVEEHGLLVLGDMLTYLVETSAPLAPVPAAVLGDELAPLAVRERAFAAVCHALARRSVHGQT
jgi:hypothetical protein